MRFLWCAYLWLPIPRSWDQFFTYPDLAFSRRNVVCPPQPHVVISICLTYVYSYLNKFAPWKWQVRRWSTAGFRSVIGLPYPASFPFLTSPMHQFFAPSPPTPPACPWSHPTHDWLPKLAGETLPHTFSTIFAKLFCLKTHLFKPLEWNTLHIDT